MFLVSDFGNYVKEACVISFVFRLTEMTNFFDIKITAMENIEMVGDHYVDGC